MLVPTNIADSPTVRRLTSAWAKLYSPNFHSLSFAAQPSLYLELLESNSPQGRAVTTGKLNEHLIQFQSEFASVQTNSFYAYMQTVMNLAEVRQIAKASFHIYKLLVQLYQHDALNLAKMPSQLQNPLHAETRTLNPSELHPIVSFSETLEPAFLEFQQMHEQSQDWRSLGFMTTQLNFCNVWLMSNLTACEQLLVQPYLQFVEEQVAHPWPRVCAAASHYVPENPILLMVEKMMPLATEIAYTTYDALLQQCPRHLSRRGGLDKLEVKHSCIRDLKMFQAYLWLCIMQESLQPVEQELLELCIQVLPSVGVKWELTSIWTEVLSKKLLQHLNAGQRQQVLPYLIEMQQIFLHNKIHLDIRL